MAFLKLFSIFLESWLEIYFDELLLFGGFSCIFNQIIQLSTISADTFFDFLFSYFIEVSIMVGERLYLVPGIDSVKDEIIDYFS